jgi:SWI/SNF-related matrix-associated actin-dependent regulator 1 of chromatin subfamily A
MMIAVDYDGDRLNVRLTKSTYKDVLKIAHNASSFEYLSNIGVMSLPGTKRIARQLYDMGLEFAPTAKIFTDNFSPNPSPDNKIDFSLLKPLTLFPYQEQGVSWLINYKDHLLLGDEQGLGKTIQIASYLFYSQSFPALIICPASLKLNWEREINIWTKKKCMILEGMNPYPIEGLLDKYPVVIINYDILGRKSKEDREKEAARIAEAKQRHLPFTHKKIHPTGWVDILKEIPFKNIICDESQYIGEEKTARTQAVIDICRGIKGGRRLFLSGTPYTAATKQFFTTLNLIAPDIFKNRWKFQMRYCDPKKNGFGWIFTGLSHGKELHDIVSKLMLRRLKIDVLKELPPKMKAIVPMELDKGLFNRYNVTENYLLSGEIRDIDRTYQELKIGACNAKYDACVTWINEYLDNNDKLVVFVYHRDTFSNLMTHYKGKVVGINGEVPTKDRLGIIEQFQNNKKIKLFVGQIKAAGVGITLTAAKAVAFIEFGNTAAEHEQAEDRIHRIGQLADSVMAYYLIAPGTLDEEIIDRIQRGYKAQKMVLDGIEGAEFISDSPGDFAGGILAARKAKLKNKD